MNPGRPSDSIAREVVLQYLYCRDAWGGQDEGFERFVRLFPTASRVSSRASALVKDILEHMDEVHRAVSAAAENWPLRRMSLVCRNVLRIGACELMFRPDVPFRVVIDEAVELAKRYEGGDAGAFVNGVLDGIASRCRFEEKAGSHTGGGDGMTEET